LFFLEVPLPDEVESYLVLQECLEMRKRYVFREDVAPWEKEIISDPSTPKPNPDPFQYTSEGKSDVSLSLLATDSCISACYKFASIDLCYHSLDFILLFLLFILRFPFLQHHFEMQDGVVHVYANKECKNMRVCFLGDI